MERRTSVRLEEDRSPAVGPNERGAGEGHYTIAPPWIRYPIATERGLATESARILEQQEPQKAREDPHGVNQVEIQEKENKQRI